MKEVILAHMGGPAGETELRGFLKNIFLDREMMRLPFQHISGRLLALLRFNASRKNYEKTGWTPVKKISSSLAAKLNAMLGKEGFAVKPLYTHTAPYIEQAAPDAVILPLYPHYSSSLAGAMKKRAPGRGIIEHWYEKEGFIKMTAANVKKSAAGLVPEKTAIMFVAHSLPESFVINGDPYIGQTNETFRALGGFFPGYKDSRCYIGKAGPQKWVGPAARDVIGGMKNIDNIIASYISFPLDNIEVLYDMDIKLREKAVESGIKNFIRADLLNDSDEFAGFLADIIRGYK